MGMLCTTLSLMLSCSGCKSGKIPETEIIKKTADSTQKPSGVHGEKQSSQTVISDNTLINYQNLNSGQKIKNNIQTIKDYCRSLYGNLSDSEFYYGENREGKNQFEYGEHDHQYALRVFANNPSEDNLPFYSFGLLSEKGHVNYNKMFLFDQTNGNISKIIDIDKYNPYLKKNDKKIEREYYFDWEQMSKYPIKNPSDRINHHHKIVKYWTGHTFRYLPESNTYVMTFYKNGMTESNEVIDIFTTHYILDSTETTIFKIPELRQESGSVTMSKDKKYLVIEFRNPELEGHGGGRLMDDGLLIYDIQAKKEIYKYTLSEQDYNDGKSWQGGGFDNDTYLVMSSSTLPYSDTLCCEYIFFDLKNKIKYSKTFTKKEFDPLFSTKQSLIKYKSTAHLMEFFTFKQEKF